jgi:hypothetical protein
MENLFAVILVLAVGVPLGLGLIFALFDLGARFINTTIFNSSLAVSRGSEDDLVDEIDDETERNSIEKFFD